MKTIVTNTDLENHLIQVAQEYAIKMNEIENHIFETAQTDIEGKTDYFVAYGKLYNPVFQQYASNKKRVYGGKASSYGRPTQYDGIVAETIGQANLKTKNSAEIYFKTDNDFEAEYLFILHKESDNWKIDSVKCKWYNEEKWEQIIM